MARRGNRAAAARNRKEKVTRSALEAQVKKTQLFRPVAGAAALAGVVGAGLLFDRGIVAAIAFFFGATVAVVLLATTGMRCPTCRTALERTDGGGFKCSRCSVRTA